MCSPLQALGRYCTHTLGCAEARPCVGDPVAMSDPQARPPPSSYCPPCCIRPLLISIIFIYLIWFALVHPLPWTHPPRGQAGAVRPRDLLGRVRPARLGLPRRRRHLQACPLAPPPSLLLHTQIRDGAPSVSCLLSKDTFNDKQSRLQTRGQVPLRVRQHDRGPAAADRLLRPERGRRAARAGGRVALGCAARRAAGRRGRRFGVRV